jgi:hypothetical protein
VTVPVTPATAVATPVTPVNGNLAEIDEPMWQEKIKLWVTATHRHSACALFAPALGSCGGGLKGCVPFCV